VPGAIKAIKWGRVGGSIVKDGGEGRKVSWFRKRLFSRARKERGDDENDRGKKGKMKERTRL